MNRKGGILRSLLAIVMAMASFHAFGAIAPTTVWECNGQAGASIFNSGGFDPSLGGTDYTHGAGYKVVTTFTQTLSGTTATISGYTVSAADLGNMDAIDSAIGGTAAGIYEIVGFNATANTWTLDRAPGAGGVSSNTLGGQFQTPDEALRYATASNTIYFSSANSNTYTTTSSTIGGLGGPLTLAVGGSNGSPIQLIGYNATRGDSGQATITIGSGQTGPAITANANYASIQNLAINAATQTGISSTNANSVVINNVATTQSVDTFGWSPDIGTVAIPPAIIFTANSSNGTQYTGCSVTNCTLNYGCQGLSIVTAPATNDGYTGFECSTNICGYQSFTGIASLNGAAAHSGATNLIKPHFFNDYIHDVCQSPLTGAVDQVTGFGMVAFAIQGDSSTTRSTGEIDSNTIANCCAAVTTTGGGGCGLYMDNNCEQVIVQKNNIYGITGPNAGGDSCGIDIETCDKTIVQFNDCHDNARAGIQIFSPGGSESNTNTTIRFNTLSDNNWFDFGNNIGASIWIQPSAIGCKIYNDTVWNSNYSELAPILNESSSTLVANNIIGASNDTTNLLSCINDTTGSATIAGNLYWAEPGTFRATYGGTTYTSLASFRTGTGQETGTGIVASPLLLCPTNSAETYPANVTTLTNFRPVATSPAIGAGLNLNSLYSIVMPLTDMSGATLPASGYNVGAWNVTTSLPSGWTTYDVLTLNDNPTAYYPMQETSGTVCHDITGHGHNLAYNSATLGVAGIAGTKAVGLTSSSSSFAGGATVGLDGQKFAGFEFTINPTTAAQYASPINRWGNTSAKQQYAIYFFSTAILGGVIYDSSTGDYTGGYAGGNTIPTGSFSQNAFVWSGANNCAIYHNGAAQTFTSAATGAVQFQSASQTTAIGGDNISSSPTTAYYGAIQRVAIYPYAPSAAQFSSHAAQGIVTVPSGSTNATFSTGGFLSPAVPAGSSPTFSTGGMTPRRP